MTAVLCLLRSLPDLGEIALLQPGSDHQADLCRQAALQLTQHHTSHRLCLGMAGKRQRFTTYSCMLLLTVIIQMGQQAAA